MIIGLSLVAAAGFSLLLWAAIQSRNVSPAGIAVDRKLAELRARGEPLTAEDIARRFPDPEPNRDALTVLQSALAFTPGARSTNLPVLSALWPSRRDPLDEAVMRNLAAYLGPYKQLLETIPDDLAGTRFSRGWTNGITLISIPFVRVRALFQTLALAALYAAESHDMQTAADALRKGFALADTIPDEQLANAVIRAHCVGWMCDAAEQVLNRGALNDEQLAGIGLAVGSRMSDTLTNALQVERYMGVFWMESARNDRTNGFASSASMASLWRWVQGERRPVYRDEDYLLFLEIMDERMAAAALPGLAQIKRSEELDQRYATNSHSLTAAILMRYLTTSVKWQCEAEAKVVTLHVALGIERYRLAHNAELPVSLDALAPKYLPAPARDPFDRQPLRFKKLPRGYVVYSIGPDGVDNGGTESPTQKVTTNYDVTFTVER
jgi:hypothetical protein